VLVKCSSLVRLDLRHNNIRDKGAGILAEVLGQCVALAHLDLMGYKNGADGAERLAGVLSQ